MTSEAKSGRTIPVYHARTQCLVGRVADSLYAGSLLNGTGRVWFVPEGRPRVSAQVDRACDGRVIRLVVDKASDLIGLAGFVLD